MVQLDGGSGGGGGDSDGDTDASRTRERSAGEMGDMVGVRVEEQSEPDPEPSPSPPPRTGGRASQPEPEPSPSANRNRGGRGSQPEPKPKSSPEPSPSPSPTGTSATVSTGGQDTGTASTPSGSDITQTGPGPTGGPKTSSGDTSTPDPPDTDSGTQQTGPSAPGTTATTATGDKPKTDSTPPNQDDAPQQDTGPDLPTPEDDVGQIAVDDRSDTQRVLERKLESEFADVVGEQRDLQRGEDFVIQKTEGGFTAQLTQSAFSALSAELSRQAARDAGRDLTATVDQPEGVALDSGQAQVGTGELQQFQQAQFRQQQGNTSQGINVEDVEKLGEQRADFERQQAVAEGQASGAAAAASALPNKIERELEAEVGTDLERGQDFTIQQTEEGGLQAQLTPEGRIKAAGVEESGQTFLDRQIEQFEASTGIDFIPGEGDVVQETEATLARAAQVQREGRGLLPSAGQAEQFITVGDDQVLAPLAPSQVVERDSPAGQQSVGQARRLAQIANPAAIALGAGKLGEAGGEFAFNIAGAAVPATATLEATGSEGRGPQSRQRDTSGLEAAAAFEQRREEQRAAQVATAKETLRKLRTESEEAVRERPFQTAGSAATELGVAVASAAVSPVRVSSTTIPLRSGGRTTARALRIEPPPVLSGATRRTGVSLVGAKGLRPTRGAPSFDLEDVDFTRLGSRAGDTFEPVGVLETEVFAKSAQRFGGDVSERTSAISSVVDVGDRPRTRRGLELTKTEDILREARAVPERKAPELAEELADLDATIKGSAAVKAQVPEARQPRDIDLIVADEAEARSRLGGVLEDTDADVGDVFDFADVEEFAGRGDIVKRGAKGRSPLRTEEGVGVNPLEEELIRKAGASGFFRGPGAGGTLDIDVGPEPRRPGRADVRRKDVADTSAIARGFLQEEFADTPIVRPFKRRRLRRQARDVEAFEQSFAGDFDFPEESVLPGGGGLFGDFDTRKLLGEADRGQVTLGNFPDIFGGGKRRARRLLDTDISDDLDDVASRGGRKSPSPGRRSPSPSVGVPAVGTGFGAGFASSGADAFESPSTGSPGVSSAPAGASPTFGLPSPDTPGVLQSPGLFDSPGGESGAPSPGAPGGGLPSGGPSPSPGEPPGFPSFGIPSGSPSPGPGGPGQPGTPGPSPTPTPGDLGIPTPFKRPDDDERRKKKDEEDILGGFAETQFTFDIKGASSLLGFEGKGPNVFEGFDPAVTGGGRLFSGNEFRGFGPSGSAGTLPDPEDISIL